MDSVLMPLTDTIMSPPTKKDELRVRTCVVPPRIPALSALPALLAWDMRRPDSTGAGMLFCFMYSTRSEKSATGVTSIQPRVTRPSLMRSGTTRLAVAMGTAKPMPTDPPEGL